MLECIFKPLLTVLEWMLGGGERGTGGEANVITLLKVGGKQINRVEFVGLVRK